MSARFSISICLPFVMSVNYQGVGPAHRCIIKSLDISGLVSKVQSLLATKAQGRNPVEGR